MHRDAPTTISNQAYFQAQNAPTVAPQFALRGPSSTPAIQIVLAVIAIALAAVSGIAAALVTHGRVAAVSASTISARPSCVGSMTITTTDDGTSVVTTKPCDGAHPRAPWRVETR